LTHTSGLEDYLNSEKNVRDNFGLEFMWEQQKLDPIEVIQGVKFKDQGEKKEYAYSNTGYIFLAKIIEQLSKQPFTAYLEQQIITPLNLENTLPPTEGNFKQAKETHKLENLVINPSDILADNVANSIGDGGIISTAEDMIKWTKALHENRDFLSKDLYELMIGQHTRTGDYGYYGYGLCIEPSAKFGTQISHNGNMGSYSSCVSYFPDQKICEVIFTTNPEIVCPLLFTRMPLKDLK